MNLISAIVEVFDPPPIKWADDKLNTHVRDLALGMFRNRAGDFIPYAQEFCNWLVQQVPEVIERILATYKVSDTATLSTLNLCLRNYIPPYLNSVHFELEAGFKKLSSLDFDKIGPKEKKSIDDYEKNYKNHCYLLYILIALSELKGISSSARQNLQDYLNNCDELDISKYLSVRFRINAMALPDEYKGKSLLQVFQKNEQNKETLKDMWDKVQNEGYHVDWLQHCPILYYDNPYGSSIVGFVDKLGYKIIFNGPTDTPDGKKYFKFFEELDLNVLTKFEGRVFNKILLEEYMKEKFDNCALPSFTVVKLNMTFLEKVYKYGFYRFKSETRKP